VPFQLTRPVQLRQYTPNPAAVSLKNHLQSEIEYTKEPSQDKDYLNAFLQERGWTLQNGDKQVIIRGTQGEDNLEIILSATIQDAPAPPLDQHTDHAHAHEHDHAQQEEGDEEQQPVDMQPGMEAQEDYFSVGFRKKTNPDWALDFKCCAHSGIIEIDKITVCNPQRKQFTIQFSELEQPSQDLFYEYLASKGINNEMAKAIFIALNEFDQEDYSLWAEQVKQFVN